MQAYLKGIKFVIRFKASVVHWESPEVFEIEIYISAPKKSHQILSLSINFEPSARKYEQSSNCCPSCATLLTSCCVVSVSSSRAELKLSIFITSIHPRKLCNHHLEITCNSSLKYSSWLSKGPGKFLMRLQGAAWEREQTSAPHTGSA